MKITSVIGAAVASVIVAAGIAVAGNFSSSNNVDFDAAGTHQFYVWCSGRSDYTTTQYGFSADDAQTRLYAAMKRAGKSSCWPVWQGRLKG